MKVMLVEILIVLVISMFYFVLADNKEHWGDTVQMWWVMQILCIWGTSNNNVGFSFSFFFLFICLSLRQSVCVSVRLFTINLKCSKVRLVQLVYLVW